MTNASPAPQTGIHLNTSFFPLSFMLYFFKPEASVDGAPALQVGWGDSFLPAAPGQHRLDVWFPYFIGGNVGKAAVMVDVPADGAAVARYKAPFWWIFSSGALTVAGPTAGGALPPGTPAAQPFAPAQPQTQPQVQPQAAAPQPAAAAAPGGAQWDAQRNAYVQWDAAQQAWFQFDQATQQWRPIS